MERNYKSICLKRSAKAKDFKSKCSRLQRHQLESMFSLKIKGLPKLTEKYKLEPEEVNTSSVRQD